MPHRSPPVSKTLKCNSSDAAKATSKNKLKGLNPYNFHVTLSGPSFSGLHFHVMHFQHCNWMPLTNGLSKKSFGSRILASQHTLPTLRSKRLLAALQFQVSLKQEGCASLATWHVQILGSIINKLSVHRSDHQEIAGDLEGTRVPPD